MQTSTVSCASAMQVSKENSIVASDKAMSTEEGKKVSDKAEKEADGYCVV